MSIPLSTTEFPPLSTPKPSLRPTGILQPPASLGLNHQFGKIRNTIMSVLSPPPVIQVISSSDSAPSPPSWALQINQSSSIDGSPSPTTQVFHMSTLSPENPTKSTKSKQQTSGS